MKKNKFILILALFLINIITIPIAYAQAATGSRLYLVLINAAIIFVALFILQAFLIPKKPEKERNAVWIIVLLASLLLAYLFGQNGFLWQHPALARFVSIYVLVNAIVIAAVLYFALGFILRDKVPKSPEGIGGYGILIFLVAMIFAVKLGNQWVWDQGTIKEFARFFFGNEGILTTNKNRIFVFIGSAVLLSWFFNFVAIGKENTKINYALAIIFAAHMASGPDPYTIDNLKTLLLIVGTWVLGNNLSEKFTGKWKIAGYVIAFVLVYWATSIVETAATPEGKAAVAGKGVIGGFFSIFWGNKFWIFLFVAVLVIMVIIFRGDTGRRALTLGLEGAKKRLNAILKRTRFQRETPEGREPQVFRENRMLLHALVNFTTRSEITYRYWKFVKQGIALASSKLYGIIGEYKDKELLRKEIMAYRSGGTTSEGAEVGGWNKLNLEAIDLINEFYEVVYHMYFAGLYKLKKEGKYEAEMSYLVAIRVRADELLRRINVNYAKYKHAMGAFGAHHVIKAYRDIILDMSNPTGDVLEHPQKFARPGAEFEGGAGFYGPEFKARTDPATGYPIDEVNQYGELVADIVAQKDKFGELPDPTKFKKPRKLKNPKDIIDYPDFITLMQNIEEDWKGLAEDIRYGLHHPYSRTIKTYLAALEKKIYPEWADDQVPFTNSPTLQDQAIDMRALANPSMHSYWGRERIDSDSLPNATRPSYNPFPALSSLGLREYLDKRITQDMRDQTLAQKFKNKYPADTGHAEKDLDAGKPIGMLLGEKPAEGKQG